MFSISARSIKRHSVWYSNKFGARKKAGKKGSPIGFIETSSGLFIHPTKGYRPEQNPGFRK